MIRRRLVAAFLAWHLFAIFVSSLPPQDRLSRSRFPDRDPATALSPTFQRVTIALDALARGTEVIEQGIWRATRPLHPAINYYVRVTGLSQTWSMFANAPTVAQYMRVRYYVMPEDGRPWTATELVLPAHREDRLRAVQSFRDSYRDKALAVAIGRFYDHRRAAPIAPETRPDQLPNDLAPVARYFAREFARTHLTAGERVRRVEVWVGTAPIPPLGTVADEAVRFERAATLESYYDGPIEERINVPLDPPYHAGEREADIGWLLEYYEEP